MRKRQISQLQWEHFAFTGHMTYRKSHMPWRNMYERKRRLRYYKGLLKKITDISHSIQQRNAALSRPAGLQPQYYTQNIGKLSGRGIEFRKDILAKAVTVRRCAAVAAGINRPKFRTSSAMLLGMTGV